MPKVTLAIYDAFGGPETEYLAQDGFMAGPTDPGSYRVAYCGRHSSRRYATWSKIPWGAPLKEDEKSGELLVRFEGRWQRVVDLTGKTKNDIIQANEDLYRIRAVPPKWVFNDFGHITCYFFEDKNKNKKFDRGLEKIHGEFFHPTPRDEALTVRGKHVDLTESHGCIHLRPLDVDHMIKSGFMKKGTLVVIHEYSVRAIPFPRQGHGVRPYELHFFPAMKKLVVLGNAK